MVTIEDATIPTWDADANQGDGQCSLAFDENTTTIDPDGNKISEGEPLAGINQVDVSVCCNQILNPDDRPSDGDCSPESTPDIDIDTDADAGDDLEIGADAQGDLTDADGPSGLI